MKNTLKAIILFLAFSMQIHVKASDAQSAPSKHAMESEKPKRQKAGELTLLEQCSAKDLGHQLDCFAINASSATATKDFLKLQVFVQQKGVFSAAGQQLKWVQGEGAVKTRHGAEITTTFGSALCEGECVAAFNKTKQELEFHALKGEWNLISFGDKDRTPLSSGESIKIGQVSSRGTSDWSLPYTVSSERFEGIMANLFGSHLTEKEKQEFTKTWKSSVESLSQLYQDRANRQIASHNESEARKAKAIKAYQEEEKQLRDLFRHKTLME